MFSTEKKEEVTVSGGEILRQDIPSLLSRKYLLRCR
jgi:hypothetical protein